MQTPTSPGSRRTRTGAGLLCAAALLAAGGPVEAPSPAPPLPVQPRPGKRPSPEPTVHTPWPALPSTTEDAAALINTLTVTTPGEAAKELSAKQVRALLRRRAKQNRLVAGWPAIIAWFQGELDAAAAAKKDARILWGVYHDSGAQVRAFRRLMGPGGLRGLHGVVVEQLRADGHWRGVSAADQRGESAGVASYLRAGDRDTWRRLRDGQRRYNYTAFKYGYLAEVMDLLTVARAAGTRLLPCDMPSPLKARLRKLPMATRMRLRELHCGLAVSRALQTAGVAAPRRVISLWGQAHVMPAGVPRFLPATTRVMSVLVHGHRHGESSLVRQLRGKVLLSAPVLLPVDDAASRLLLLLPGSRLGARLDLTRDHLTRPLPAAMQHRLLVHGAGELTVGGRVVVAGGEQGRSVSLPAGRHAYLLARGATLLAGALKMPRGGRAELWPEPSRRVVEVTVFIHSVAAGK